MLIRTLFGLFVTVIIVCHPATGQDKAEVKGFRGEFLGMFEHESGKVMQLANAMPEDKYSWRPGEGVRSVAEVYMHIAGANIMLPAMITGEKIDFNALMAREKEVTSKADIAKELAMSIENVKKIATNMSDADLEKSVTIPFIPLTTTARGVLMMIMSHVSEHLGQSIAYSRTVGVTPPWTAAQSGSGAE